MNRNQDISQGKSVDDLGWEAFWFLTHTFLAFMFLALVIGAITLTNPDPAAIPPKLLCTALAFLVPLIGALIIAPSHQNHIAGYLSLPAPNSSSLVSLPVLLLPPPNP